MGVGVATFGATTAAAQSAPAPAPPTLRETGLYSDWESLRLHPEALPFSPQYPLWTDGADKRRWIHLPPGTFIQAITADHWEFPVGTKLWKEFAFAGRRIETRYLERIATGWRFGTYLWSEDQREAVLAPMRGIKRTVELRPGVFHAIPGTYECRMCHEGRSVPVIGFSALQLSGDRDPAAPHALQLEAGSVDVAALVARGLLRGVPVPERARIPAHTPEARAALGYLHGNCGHCHNAEGPLAALGLELWQPVETHASAGERSTANVVSQFQPPGVVSPAPLKRVSPGEPDLSVLFLRMSSREPLAQMPPLGTAIPDEAALGAVAAWIHQQHPQPTGAPPSAATPSTSH